MFKVMFDKTLRATFFAKNNEIGLIDPDENLVYWFDRDGNYHE